MMKHPDPSLVTPIYVLTHADMPLPKEEKVYYLLTGTGLYLCRNHRFFSSCVPAPEYPSELAPQKQFLKARFPKLERRLLEQIIGFFDRIGRDHGAEAAAILAWDDHARCVRAVVPRQIATVSVSWQNHTYPLDVHYATPNLPSGLTYIGDIHSHVNESAYASYMDKQDEAYGAGLHIVVGRIGKEPPEFHIEAAVDGVRFRVEDASLVFAGYRKRSPDFPREWLGRVKVAPWKDYHASMLAAWEQEDGADASAKGELVDGSGVGQPPAERLPLMPGAGAAASEKPA